MPSTTESVQRCLDAYTRARSAAGPESAVFGPHTQARINLAYRRAMPFLTPAPNAIDTFIACVTHGIILQVYEPAEASKLLYAAQIALSSLRARTQAAKAQPKPDAQGAPSLGTASSSPRVGDHEPQQGTPGPSHMGTGEQCHPATLTPQAPPTPSPLASNGTNNLQPQVQGAPSLETASSSPRVGDHEPQPPTVPPRHAATQDTTPSPRAKMAPKAQWAAPQVPRNQIDEILEQLYSGKLPPIDPTRRYGTNVTTPSPLDFGKKVAEAAKRRLEDAASGPAKPNSTN